MLLQSFDIVLLVDLVIDLHQQLHHIYHFLIDDHSITKKIRVINNNHFIAKIIIIEVYMIIIDND